MDLLISVDFTQYAILEMITFSGFTNRPYTFCFVYMLPLGDIITEHQVAAHLLISFVGMPDLSFAVALIPYSQPRVCILSSLTAIRNSPCS